MPSMKTLYRTLSIIIIAAIHLSFTPIEKKIDFVPFSIIQNDTIKTELQSICDDIEINTSIRSFNLYRYDKVRVSESAISFHHKGYSRWYSVSFNSPIRYTESSKSKIIGVESGRNIFSDICYYHEKYMLQFDSASLTKINEVVFSNCREKESSIRLQPYMSADKKRQYLAIKISGNAHNNVILLCISAKDPFYTSVATK